MTWADVLLEFHVHGNPKPQGSKTLLPHGGMRESSKALPDWRRAVGQRGGDAMNGRSPYDQELVLDVVFYLPRPKGHYGTGRNAGTLKASAPLAPATMPDLDKLVRAVCDALTNVVWTSDALVVAIRAAKRYADSRPTGARVTIRGWATGSTRSTSSSNDSTASSSTRSSASPPPSKTRPANRMVEPKTGGFFRGGEPR